MTPKIDYLPMGLCPSCLERVAAGVGVAVRALADGAQLFSAYCVERQAGASIIVGPGRAPQWTVKVPIDALRWARHVELLPAIHEATLRGVADASRPAPGDVH